MVDRQFCELLIYRSSSKMFKLRVLVSIQRDNVPNATVGCVVFITVCIFTD